ncbi:hypothetical protein ABBQ32_007163 [Trebouxia sp. C0010 RCD-2024]
MGRVLGFMLLALVGYSFSVTILACALCAMLTFSKPDIGWFESVVRVPCSRASAAQPDLRVSCILSVSVTSVLRFRHQSRASLTSVSYILRSRSRIIVYLQAITAHCASARSLLGDNTEKKESSEAAEGSCWCYTACGLKHPAGCSSNPRGPKQSHEWVNGFVTALIEIHGSPQGGKAHLALLALIKADNTVALDVLVKLKVNAKLFVDILLKIISVDVIALCAVLKLKLSLVAFLLLNVNIKVQASLKLCVQLVLQLLAVVEAKELAKVCVSIPAEIIGVIFNSCGSAGVKLQACLNVIAQINLGFYKSLGQFCDDIRPIYVEAGKGIAVAIGIGK